MSYPNINMQSKGTIPTIITDINKNTVLCSDYNIRVTGITTEDHNVNGLYVSGTPLNLITLNTIDSKGNIIEINTK